MPFDEVSLKDRCASTCLTDAFRSQGFAPSQRLNPPKALWLYFAPLPSIGFEPSELFPPSQPLRLSAPVSLMPFRLAATATGEPIFVATEHRGFRALLRLSIRHPIRSRFNLDRAAALLAFPLFEAYRRRLRDRSPAPHMLHQRDRLCTADRESCIPGYYSQTWELLRESLQPP